MRDDELAHEILRQLVVAAKKVVDRSSKVSDPDDFVRTPEGMLLFDAVCMQCVVIGELIKNLDKVTDGELLAKYPQIDWKKAMGMRDIISHHYADVRADIVLATCQEKIPPLLRVLEQMLS
jgi:uncharacterized protein with HEPN domain